MGTDLVRYQASPNKETLCTDIDLQLADLFTAVWEAGGQKINKERGVKIVGSAIRQAYARGYADALEDDRQGARSALFTRNGYPAIPPAEPKGVSA